VRGQPGAETHGGEQHALQARFERIRIDDHALRQRRVCPRDAWRVAQELAHHADGAAHALAEVHRRGPRERELAVALQLAQTQHVGGDAQQHGARRVDGAHQAARLAVRRHRRQRG
jgi:hypothetical protein